MFFKWNGQKYDVDVERALKEAAPEDYRPDLEENGVVIKEFENHEDFQDCKVCLFFNPTTEQVSIQLEKEDYLIISDPCCSFDELETIKKMLSD